MAHWFNCDTNFAPVGRGSPKTEWKKLGNANHAYKGSNNKKKSLNQSIQNYNQST